MMKLKRFTGLFLSTSLLTFHFSTHANGFRLPEYTAAGIATSNALAADTSRLSAIAYNPAIMSLYELETGKKNFFSGSLLQIQYDSEVSTNIKTTQSIGESTFNIPSMIIGTKITDKLSFALLIHSPFGLETKWPTDTFSSFASDPKLEPGLSKIKMYNANFNAAYKLSVNSGLAIGINQYHLLDLQFNSQATVIKGDTVGYGWNAAFITKLNDDTSLGISYRSEVKARASGTAANVLPIALDVTFPEILTIGLNVAISDNLKLELDIEHTGWRVFDNLNIRNSTNNTTVKTSTNNWSDTLTYRASGQYKMSKHQILFGYAYDATPQGDAKFSARIPDSDRQLFSIGYQYDFGSFQLETGLMIVKFDNRTVNSTTTYVPGSPPNGTTVYNGTYRANATIFSVGINTTF